MQENVKENEGMTKEEFQTMMRLIRKLIEKSEDKAQLLEEFDEVTGIKKEPTPTTK